jgi:mRNA interferase RelE/StbE
VTSRSRRPAGEPGPELQRKTGRHPAAERTVVRFTDAAFEDLKRMTRKGDPQVVRWALTKCLLLERDPEAGEELRGGLIGYRKLTVGDRDWRIVWRVTHDDAGWPVVDVAEVWAIGARSDSEVYEEMQSRVATLSASPATMPLAEAIELLGKVGKDITPTSAEPEPGAQPAVPEWLVQVLTTVVKMPRDKVDHLTEEQAQEIWDAYIRTPR